MEKNKIQSNAYASTILPDLTMQMCPFSCSVVCERIWTNRIIDHKIICNCNCHKIKNDAADGFGRPDSAASGRFTLEVSNDNDL